MSFIFDHFRAIFFFSSFPLAGWIMSKVFNQKVIASILFSSIVLLLPFLTAYRYLSENVYPGLAYMLISSIYASLMQEKFIKRPLVTFSVLFLIIVLAFNNPIFSLVSPLLPTEPITDKEWELRGYKVKHTTNIVLGDTIGNYELYKYGIIPIFIKQVAADPGHGDGCTIKFFYKNVSFNKCSTSNR